MRWFKNLRIAVKLITAFAVMALITALMGLYGIMNMRSVDDDYTALYEDYGIALANLGYIGMDFNIIEYTIRDILMTDSRSEKQALYDTIKAKKTKIAADLDAFGKTIRTQENYMIFESLKAAMDKYYDQLDQIYKLSLEQSDVQAERLMPQLKNYSEEAGKIFFQLYDARFANGNKHSKSLSDQTESTTWTMVGVIFLAMVVGLGFGLFISRLISNPVRKLVDVADKIAEGDLRVAIDIDTKDEIGRLAQAFRTMSDNLNEMMLNIQTAADQVASGSRQISASSISLSQGATEQASSIEQLTASIEEIAAQTQHNANNSNEANQLAETARQTAIHGNNQMKEMLTAMEDINTSSVNISKIIKVIEEIAFQTNILALNAAVEAARAGQHGKGFAVVAEEVRNLAARSANAAKETTELIESSIRKVEVGTKIANETAEALQKIVDDVARVAKLIHDVANASNEQAIGINQINQGIMQVSQVVQENSSTSEETAAASEQLSSQAQLLKTQVSRFKLRDTHYGGKFDIYDMKSSDHQVYDSLADKWVNVGQTKAPNEDGSPQPRKIDLSDHDFGKY